MTLRRAGPMWLRIGTRRRGRDAIRMLFSRYLGVVGGIGALVVLACGGSSEKSSAGDAAAADGMAGDENTSEAGGCAGVAPICCALAPGGCSCPRDPPFSHATCSRGAWACALGYELELACHVDSGAGVDSGGGGEPCGIDEAGAWSPPPECYGTDLTKCCIQGGTGSA